MKIMKTSFYMTFKETEIAGVFNLDASIGVYAPDTESYKTFAALFDPIIQDYHGFSPKDKQPPVDLGEGKRADFPPLDPNNKYIIKNALTSLNDGELAGTYYPLEGMSRETQNRLIQDHFLFKEGDRHLQQANACNYWPKVYPSTVLHGLCS
uniref:arginine kinase n=1 Tax=Parascaris equorum TaxID=6256 RepID=A0A914RGJ4_PAREQ